MKLPSDFKIPKRPDWYDCDCPSCTNAKNGLGRVKPCERYTRDAVPKPPKPPEPRIIKYEFLSPSWAETLNILIPLLIGVIVGIALAQLFGVPK